MGTNLSTAESVVQEEEKFWENHDEFDWLTPQSVREVVAQCPKPTGRVLELCCGSGMFTKHVSFEAVNSYIGLDIAESLLSKLSADLPGVTTVKGNAEAPDFEPESFDYIFIFAGLHHLPRIKTCLDSCYKLLKPGGTFCCFEPNIKCFGRKQMLKMKSVARLLGVVYTDDEIFLDPDLITQDLKEVGFIKIQNKFITPRYRYYGLVNLLRPLIGIMNIVSSLPFIGRKHTQTFFITTAQK